MKVTQEWIELILSKNNRWRSIAKVVGFQIIPGVAKGENYSSDMSRLLVDVLLDSGQRESISIIVKSMPSTEFRRARLTEMGVFLREIYVYRDIIPNMEKLMEEAGDKSETVWCKCMDYTPYETLVLEDLSERGYKLVDRLKGLDFEHSKLAVLALAKFHAISVALQERGFIPLNIFEKGVYENAKAVADQFQEDMLLQFIEQSNKSWDDEWKPILAKIEHKMLRKIARLVDESTLMDESTFRVLCHSDFWHNNMLFKYDEEGCKPVIVNTQHTRCPLATCSSF
ncbi:uncharacterized protein LOC106671002 isoform X2 [Cimex lectularius]|uniref:CHK kinase-like domain-containing protein n=1 Tax=Cimex lectularius TaxID=79782 RepID=A0A8I6SQG7_CIMLE|nr:uncharacterized protein LOC106671002 isoform X2 [Cimex lectularius]